MGLTLFQTRYLKFENWNVRVFILCRSPSRHSKNLRGPSLCQREGPAVGKVSAHVNHVFSDNEETYSFWQMLRRYSFEVQIAACLIVAALHSLHWNTVIEK